MRSVDEFFIFLPADLCNSDVAPPLSLVIAGCRSSTPVDQEVALLLAVAYHGLVSGVANSSSTSMYDEGTNPSGMGSVGFASTLLTRVQPSP